MNIHIASVVFLSVFHHWASRAKAIDNWRLWCYGNVLCWDNTVSYSSSKWNIVNKVEKYLKSNLYSLLIEITVGKNDKWYNTFCYYHVFRHMCLLWNMWVWGVWLGSSLDSASGRVSSLCLSLFLLLLICLLKWSTWLHHFQSCSGTFSRPLLQSHE